MDYSIIPTTYVRHGMMPAWWQICIVTLLVERSNVKLHLSGIEVLPRVVDIAPPKNINT